MMSQRWYVRILEMCPDWKGLPFFVSSFSHFVSFSSIRTCWQHETKISNRDKHTRFFGYRQSWVDIVVPCSGFPCSIISVRMNSHINFFKKISEPVGRIKPKFPSVDILGFRGISGQSLTILCPAQEIFFSFFSHRTCRRDETQISNGSW